MAEFVIANAVKALFGIFQLLIFLSVVSSWLPFLWENKFMAGIMGMIESLTEPLLSPVRKLLEKTPAGNMPLDFSPVITLLILSLLEGLVLNLILAVM